MAPIIKILLLIDGVIYDLIDGVYDIFDFLARLNIFGEDSYNDIVGRIYIVLGVIMLFVLAYTLLRAIINPDDFAKGEKSFPNLAKNVVISLVLIVLLPTIFNVAFSMQNALLNTGTITKLILGDTNLDYTEKYQNETITMTPGKMMAVNTFSAFFYPNPENPVCGDSGVQGTRTDVENCKDNITADGFIWRNSKITLRQVDTEVKAGKSMTAYNKFSDAVADDEIHYTVIISTVAGVFLLYVLLNFCFDMALRVVKLMFYQIIAPIPIICRVIPFGTLKDVFNNWLKQVLSTFFEVFVRIAIMNFGVLLIKLCLEAFNSGYRNGILSVGRAEYNLSWLQFSLARLLVIFGIVMFIRKAPELISKMFGIDTGGMKLGLRDKLQQSGVYTAGAVAGGAVLGSVRNFAKSKREGNGRLKTLGSTIAGGFSSSIRAGYGARNAKSLSEASKATSAGLAAAAKKRQDRITYKAKHPEGVMKGHATDAWEWFTGKGVEDLDAIIKAASNISSANDDFRAAVKKQVDKHRTDKDIVATGVKFKGVKISDDKATNDAYINQLYDENFKGKSLAEIEQGLAQYETEINNRDYRDAAVKALEAETPEIVQPKKEDFMKMYPDGYERFDQSAFDAAMSEYQDKVKERNDKISEEAVKRARQMSQDEARKMAHLKSMFAQIEKETINSVGQHAISGTAVGTIKAEDLFEAGLKGKNFERVVSTSGLGNIDEIKDPATGEMVKNEGNTAKFYDDIASAASRQSTEASLERQRYLEKKSKE